MVTFDNNEKRVYSETQCTRFLLFAEKKRQNNHEITHAIKESLQLMKIRIKFYILR